jgi:glycosyltransferase involved in cell wall biosynthesis
MKIAHINMFYLPTYGGVEKVMQELAERQVKSGHEVHVFCCDSDKNKRIKVKEEIINGVHVHRYPYWFRLTLNTFIWPSLIWKLPSYKFDIIHSHVSGHAYVLIAGVIAKIKKIPHIHTTHCPWTDAFRPFYIKPFLFLNDILFNHLAYGMCTKIISITPWEHEILKKYGATQYQIVDIPNGTPNIFFEEADSAKFIKKYKLKSRVVLFFGRLNPTKGPDKFVLAAKEILKKRKDLSFVMVGPDEGMKDKVKNLIGKDPNILLLDAIRDPKEIAAMYQAADVYVLPSYREGLPLTIFEAMASGLPIVASPVNGIPYAMEEYENGFFAEYGNITSLQDKIMKIITDTKLAKQISKKNKEKAKNYKWDIIAKKTEELYEKVISSKH